MTAQWFERDQPVLAAHGQAALLLDLVLTEASASHKVLNSTGIFYEDLVSGERLLSADKLFRLIRNCLKHYSGDDLAFRFAQRLVLGQYHDFGQTLSSASNLRQVFQLLHQFGTTVSPLLTPRYYEAEGLCELRWYPAFAKNDTHRFLCEAYVSAFSQAMRSLSGLRLPWRFEFDFERPASMEQYEVNFGAQVCFNRPVSKMSIAAEYAHRPCPRGASLIYQQGLQRLQKQGSDQEGFLYLVCRLMHTQISRDVSLDSIAEQLHMSSATLKRKLKLHGTCFRQLLDTVRMEVAVELVEKRAYTNEQVAAHLGFYDEANFRRSFKRWTGLNPSQYFAVQ